MSGWDPISSHGGGGFVLVSTLFCHDGVVVGGIWADRDGVAHLGVFADESDNDRTYVLAPMTDAAHVAVLNGSIEVRTVFNAPAGGHLLRCVVDDEHLTVRRVRVAAVPDNLLPAAGLRLR